MLLDHLGQSGDLLDNHHSPPHASYKSFEGLRPYILTPERWNLAKKHRAYVVTIADEVSTLVDGLKAGLKTFSAKWAS
jgi:hypothetical protein